MVEVFGFCFAVKNMMAKWIWIQHRTVCMQMYGMDLDLDFFFVLANFDRNSCAMIFIWSRKKKSKFEFIVILEEIKSFANLVEICLKKEERERSKRVYNNGR